MIPQPKLDIRQFFRNVYDLRKSIFTIGLCGFFLSLIVGAIYSPRYTANVSLHARDKVDGASIMAGKFGGAAEFLSGGAVRNSNEYYMELLRTRLILDGVIEKKDLSKTYNMRSPERLRKKLLENTKIGLGKGDIITICVTDKSPKMAAELSNLLALELQQKIASIANSSAARQEEIYLSHMLKTKKDIEIVRSKMIAVQVKNGSFPVYLQGEALSKQIEGIDFEITKLETKWAVLQQTETTHSRNSQELETELKILKQKRSALKDNRNGEAANQLPGKENEMQVLMGNLVRLEQTYQFLLRSYEMAQIDAKNSALILEVIDPAVPPERPDVSKKMIGFAVFILVFATNIVIHGFFDHLQYWKHRLINYFESV